MTTALQTKTIQCNDVELQYVEQGTGEPLILIHGGVSDLRTWELQMEPFSQHYRVLAYSMRYHYPNKWSGDGSDYTTTQHVQDLATLIQQVALAPVHLVGSSYGGDVALYFAREHPKLVRTLVLGEPPVIALLLQLLAGAPDAVPPDAASQWERASRAVEQGDIEGGARLFLNHVIGEGAFDHLPEAHRRVLMDNVRLLTLPQEVFYSPFSCDDAARIMAPTLLLTGDGSPKQFLLVSQELTRCLPQVEHASIPRASHLLHAMNPQVYNEAVLSFLAQH